MTNSIRFGVWAAVHGSRAAHQDPEEPFDASWERNRRLVLEAEALGFDSTLIAQHTFNPSRPGLDQLDAWTAAAGLAAITTRIELIAAIKPQLFHPVLLAKMALQIEAISRGRFAINLVNAWNKAEYERIGLNFAEHDDRYAYGREWVSIVSRLLAGENVTQKSVHFDLKDCLLFPRSAYRARPTIYVGGESDPARDLVADEGDVWFINGQPLPDVEALISDVRRRPRRDAPLRFGLSAFVIARDTAAEAQSVYEHLLTLAAKDVQVRETQRANTDAKAVMWQTLAKAPRIGSNGGTGAGLVGSYDEVADGIKAFHRAGIELFMLQFQPFETEMARFAREIFPRVRDKSTDAGTDSLRLARAV